MKNIGLKNLKHLRPRELPVDAFASFVEQYKNEDKIDASSIVSKDVCCTIDFEKKLLELLAKVKSDFMVCGMRYLSNITKFKFVIEARPDEGDKSLMCIEMRREERRWKIHQIMYNNTANDNINDSGGMCLLFN